jgi:uncharacterized membrane protein
LSDLIILAFRTHDAAFVAAENLAALQQEANVEPEDIVVVTRSDAGRVAVNHLTDLATGSAPGGGAWGTLIAMLFLDNRPARTTESGMAAQFREAGIDGKFLDDAVGALNKVGAVVGMRVRLLGVERVVDRAKAFGGSPKVIRTRVNSATEDRLIEMQAQIPRQVLAQVRAGGGL